MVKETLLHLFREHIRQRQLINRGDKIIVAVSGGIDSVVLLHLLASLKTELDLQLVVAHFNHKLRGQESDEDEKFVQILAKQFHIEWYGENSPTSSIAQENKMSIQETARELRYQFFLGLRDRLGFARIATAHNANDNAETVLFNLLRGTGVKGLAGIPMHRPETGIIRPLLFATRYQIEQYAVEQQLTYREDSSNKKTEYSRNFIRHDIIPKLTESINSNLISTLNRNAELFTLLDSYLQEQVKILRQSLVLESSAEQTVLDREKFICQPEFMQYYLLYYAAKEFTPVELSFDTIKEMLSVSNAETGSCCNIGNKLKLYRDRNHLVLTNESVQENYQIPVALNKDISFDNFTFSSAYVGAPLFTDNRFVEYIDAGRLGTTLSLRNWKHGDWFIPLGMSEKKKLSDFFVEQKVPVFKKHSVPLFTSNDSIVWVCGQRLDERFKVKPSTTSILKLEYKPCYE